MHRDFSWAIEGKKKLVFTVGDIPLASKGMIADVSNDIKIMNSTLKKAKQKFQKAPRRPPPAVAKKKNKYFTTLADYGTEDTEELNFVQGEVLKILEENA